MNEETLIKEPLFRINIQQSAKGFFYFDVIVRNDNVENLKELLDTVTNIAKTKCDELNKGVKT